MKKILTFLSICIVSIGLDWWTKILSIEHLQNSYPRQYLGGVFRLVYAENTGAWGSMGSDWSPFWRMAFLIILPMVVLLGMAGFALFNKKISALDLWSYAFIVSGGMGNLIDRIRYGHVVDFMWMGFDVPFGHTNIFNIADVAIMTGFGLLLLGQYKEWKLKKVSLSSNL